MTPRGSQKFLRSVFRIGRDRNKFMRPYPRDILFTTVSTGLCEEASSIDPRPRLYTYLSCGGKKVCNDLLRSLFNVFPFTISPYLHQRCLSNVRKHLLIAWTIRLKRVPILFYPRCKIEKEKNIEKNARREAKSNPSISKSASSIGRNRSMIICGKLNNEQNGEFCLNSA